MPFDGEGRFTPTTAATLEEFTESLSEQVAEMPVELQEFLGQRFLPQVDYQERARANEMKIRTIQNFPQGTLPWVNIVIPVHGALHLLKQCVRNVRSYTKWPHYITVVDDCTNDAAMTQYLNELATDPVINVLVNRTNRGFAASVNRGARNSGHLLGCDYFCALNSDVLVTPDWLTKMMLAMLSDKYNVIVNPATNNTALNALPMAPGRSYKDMNRALERRSRQVYPEIVPSGFCWLMRRDIYEELGGLDEAYVSYGEETDLWFRAINMHNDRGELLGHKAVLADDTYVFHERGSSFSQLGEDSHGALRKSGAERFHRLNPGFRSWKKGHKEETILSGFRAPIPPGLFGDESPYRVAYVVNSAAWCGGMKFIADIVNSWIEAGVDAKVCVIKRFEGEDIPIADLRTAPIYFDSDEDFVENFESRVFDRGVLIAAVAQNVPAVAILAKKNKHFHTIHHVQSDDVSVARELDPEQIDNIASCFGKLDKTVVSSYHLSKELRQNGIDNACLLPGVDTDVFHRGFRETMDDRYTIMMPLMKNYKFKGYERGVELAKTVLEKTKGRDIRILAYGVDNCPEERRIECLGEVSQTQLGKLLREEVDVFVDPAHLHSYGMPLVEALSSGCIAYAFKDNRGALAYLDHVQTYGTVEDMVSQLTLPVEEQLHADPNEAWIDDRFVQTSMFIKFVEDEFKLGEKETKNIVVVTPHLRKHGGPTTLVNFANACEYFGHNVTLVSCYTDYNPEVYNMSHVPISSKYDDIPECDILFCNSDNPFIEEIFAQKKHKKAVMIKLSHNERFKEIEESSLRLPWDHIITSTDHLRQNCLEVTEDWHYIKRDEDEVTTLGWYHYMHPLFDNPQKTYRAGTLEQPIRILTLFHAHATKGTPEAVQIFSQLKDEYGDRIELYGVGETPLQVLPKYVRHYFLSPSREEMASIMQSCDIFLHPSRTEGLGRMILEAMSAHCAVVSTDTGADFLKNVPTFPVGEADKGLEAVQTLIENPDALREVGDIGYQIAIEKAEPSDYLESIESVLEKL